MRWLGQHKVYLHKQSKWRFVYHNLQSALPQDIPVYFVSTVAESSLAFSNIYSEWLSEEKGGKVNIPEEPFHHSEVLFFAELN